MVAPITEKVGSLAPADMHIRGWDDMYVLVKCNLDLQDLGMAAMLRGESLGMQQGGRLCCSHLVNVDYNDVRSLCSRYILLFLVVDKISFGRF